MTVTIAGIPIGAGHPAVVVAEVGNAHNGDFVRAIRLLDAIKASGATFAKFQCYTPSELIALRGDGPAPEPWGASGWTMGTLYEQAQTPHAWFPDLVAHCGAIGLPWLSSVFGAESLALLESLDCPAYKLAALDYGARWLRELVYETRRPVVRSCRAGSADMMASDTLTLLCPPGYPQAAHQLREIRYSFDGYSEIRYGFDGYSYHGTDPTVPTFAVVAGASIVEVHVELPDEPSALESNVSLTTTQLTVLVRAIQRAERLMA